MLRLRADATAPGEKGQIVAEFQDPYLELVRLLREASEIEHALLVQYLFAGFSVKPQYEDVAGTGFPSLPDSFVGVAVQEMGHLNEVNELLTQLGASPNLSSQDFPYEPDIYPFAFNLEPMSRKSVAKYVWTEARADEPFLHELKDDLGAIHPNHLGSLYATIICAVKEVMASPPTPGLDLSAWPTRLEAVKSEGEDDHFHFFREVYKGTHAGFGGQDVWKLDKSDPNYPAFDFPVNPTAFINRPGSIHDEKAAAVAWLADLHYWIILALLDLRYRHSSARAMFFARGHMNALSSLGKHLATLGSGLPFDSLSMGYNLGRTRAESIRILGHLLAEADAEAEKLRPDLPPDYPFLQIQQTVTALPQL
jgi:ferritin-like protein